MTIDRRRLICPSLTRPMSTGDGCLARLAPLNAPLHADRLHHLAAASATWGNGVVEVTRRGNVQCRGFPCCEDNTFRPVLGKLPGQAGSRFPISVDPAGLWNPSTEPTVTALYAGLHDALRAHGLEAHVAPKISLVISAGSGLGYDTLAADVQLHVETQAHRCQIFVGIGRSLTPGDMRWQGVTDQPLQAINAVVTLLRAIGDQGPLVRARGLADAHLPPLPLAEGAPMLAAPLCIGDTLEAPNAKVWGIPCGRLNSTDIAALGDLCARMPLAVWPIPERRLLVIGERVHDADQTLRSLGLIDDALQPLPYIDLCAGRDCPRAGIDSHAMARRLAALLTTLPVPVSAHVSGCPKRCARDIPALITLSGDDRDNRVRFILNGQPGDVPQWEGEHSETLWPLLTQLVAWVARTPQYATNVLHWQRCWQAVCADAGL